ncbi:OadG family transporter subunit [Marinospirillum sp.]|uniref:OadG family protein n=1 Tax=Marinospirillum sp. TaxID=2183934 RepID=UPI00287003FA|nr:OadG family transporter subunit [Marinospirillum sp.]MDR9467047.1 OadG family transporter subunit [Marinospirillum sp.]
MQDADLMAEGLNLMLLGMGFVFVFLTVLVIATTVMSKTINRFFPSPEIPTQGGIKGRKASEPSAGQSSQIVAAISAAIQLHRQRKQ